MRDDLLTWCDIRASIDWPNLDSYVGGPVHGVRDGVTHFIDTHARARDPERADRLLDALRMARAYASSDRPLTFDVLATWQGVVLGTDSPVAFRRGVAFAKGGRERYGIDETTPHRFAACLSDADDPTMPVSLRAARAYLDVCFFHPFPDGNGRAALLALAFLLARADITIDQAAPLFLVSRRADDRHGAEGLARLIDTLIYATRRRSQQHDGFPFMA